MRRRPAQRGFGLLEAIVALTLLASTGVALFAWINTNLQAAVRLKERDAAASLKIIAIGLMSGVNPLMQPAGERELGSVKVRWTAAPAGPLRPTAGQAAGGTGRFVIQVFTLSIEAHDSHSEQSLRFELQLIGSRLSEMASTPSSAR